MNLYLKNCKFSMYWVGQFCILKVVGIPIFQGICANTFRLFSFFFDLAGQCWLYLLLAESVILSKRKHISRYRYILQMVSCVEVGVLCPTNGRFLSELWALTDPASYSSVDSIQRPEEASQSGGWNASNQPIRAGWARLKISNFAGRIFLAHYKHRDLLRKNSEMFAKKTGSIYE